MAHANTNTSTKTSYRDKARGFHAKIKHHYYRRMPDKKHHRILIWVVFSSVVGIIAAQLLYPLDRALPLAKFDGELVGWQKEDALAYKANERFLAAEIQVSAGDKTVQDKVSHIGGEINVAREVAPLLDYPFWWRFVPGSILFFSHDVTALEVRYADRVLQDFAEDTAKKLSVAPQNAGVTFKDGSLVATDDKPGRSVAASDVVRTLRGTNLSLDGILKVQVPSKTQSAETTAGDLAQVRAWAELALTREVHISADTETFVPNSETRASWLELVQDEQGDVVLRFNKSKAAAYIDTMNKKVGRTPGTTVIRMVDGKEDRRTIGATGRTVNKDSLTDQLEPWMLHGTGSGNITAEFTALPPQVTYSRTYTHSEAGLRAYVADASRLQNANIVVHQINGNQWSAGANGTLSIPSASTYKLYIAWILFTKMNNGEISWGDKMLDTNVSGCFDRMTIASTNACSEQWIADFGRTNINNFLYSRGYSRGTTFTSPVATHTTAQDLAKFMTALENGSIINGAHRDRLLRSLSVHPYRAGVPTGSAGRVWDKVGFLWDYIHDAAIVYHPKGKYVIVVMTKGRSYATIAEITRQVERIMYP